MPGRDLLADYPDTRTGERVVYYDAGMLIALLAKDARVRAAHEVLRKSPHRPIITGPVLAQVGRDGPPSFTRSPGSSVSAPSCRPRTTSGLSATSKEESSAASPAIAFTVEPTSSVLGRC